MLVRRRTRVLACSRQCPTGGCSLRTLRMCSETPASTRSCPSPCPSSSIPDSPAVANPPPPSMGSIPVPSARASPGPAPSLAREAYSPETGSSTPAPQNLPPTPAGSSESPPPTSLSAPAPCARPHRPRRCHHPTRRPRRRSQPGTPAWRTSSGRCGSNPRGCSSSAARRTRAAAPRVPRSPPADPSRVTPRAISHHRRLTAVRSRRAGFPTPVARR